MLRVIRVFISNCWSFCCRFVCYLIRSDFFKAFFSALRCVRWNGFASIFFADLVFWLWFFEDRRCFLCLLPLLFRFSLMFLGISCFFVSAVASVRLRMVSVCSCFFADSVFWCALIFEDRCYFHICLRCFNSFESFEGGLCVLCCFVDWKFYWSCVIVCWFRFLFLTFFLIFGNCRCFTSFIVFATRLYLVEFETFLVYNHKRLGITKWIPILPLPVRILHCHS
jgi:hypothetical protein